MQCNLWSPIVRRSTLTHAQLKGVDGSRVCPFSAAALQLLTKFVHLYSDLACAPELLAPVAEAAVAMGPQSVPAVEALRQALIADLTRTHQQAVDRSVVYIPMESHAKLDPNGMPENTLLRPVDHSTKNS
eukprot:9485167-Pyramimonas_sp.AAC.2